MTFNYWQDFEEGNTYHLYNRAVSDELLFRDATDYDTFLAKFSKYFGDYFKVYAYCLIPNHFHFLVKVKSKDDFHITIRKENTKKSNAFLEGDCSLNEFLVDQLRRLFSSISLTYNAKYKRRGPLFSPKLKRVMISGDVKFNYLLAYIHHNPIHHGLVTTYTEWIYSSYYVYIRNIKTKISKEEVIEWIGGKDVFLQLHKNFALDNKESNNLDNYISDL